MSKAGHKTILVALPNDWDDPEDLPHIIEPVPDSSILDQPKIIGQALEKFRKALERQEIPEKLLNDLLEE